MKGSPITSRCVAQNLQVFFSSQFDFWSLADRTKTSDDSAASAAKVARAASCVLASIQVRPSGGAKSQVNLGATPGVCVCTNSLHTSVVGNGGSDLERHAAFAV